MEAYIDGGVTTHKKIGGWGLVIVENNQIKYTDFGVIKSKITVNRMELTALLEAMKYTKKPLTIYSDCLYVVKGFNLWLKEWKRFEWKKTNGKDIKNSDLWKKVDNLKREDMKVKWIKRCSNTYSELADELSKKY